MPAYRSASPTDPAGTRGRGVVQPRHRQLLGQPGQVGPTGREAAERDVQRGAHQPVDHARSGRCPTARRRPAGPPVERHRDLHHSAERGVRHSAVGRHAGPPRPRASGSASPSSSTVRAPGTISTALSSPASRRRVKLGEPGGRVVDLEQQRVGAHRPYPHRLLHLSRSIINHRCPTVATIIGHTGRIAHAPGARRRGCHVNVTVATTD